MKKFFTILLLVSPLLFTGCIELTTLVNLNTDGSGTIEETVLLSSQVAAMISQFGSSFSEDSTTTSQPFSIYNEKEVIDKASEFGPGVKYVSSNEIKTDQQEGFKAVYSFNDINNLIIDQNPGSKISVDPSVQEPTDQKQIMHFSFIKDGQSVLTIKFPEKKAGAEKTDSVMQVSLDSTSSDSASLQQMASLIKDLKIAMILNINGTISETNASYVKGSTVTLMNISFGELLNKKETLNELKGINPSDITNVKQVLQKLPGIQMELNNPVTIKFK